MVLPLLAGLGVLVLVALAVSVAICVAAARADHAIRSSHQEGDPALRVRRLRRRTEDPRYILPG